MDLYATVRNTDARNAIAISRLNKTVERIGYIPILLGKSVLYQAWLPGTLQYVKYTGFFL